LLEVFRDLEIGGSKTKLRTLVSELGKSLPDAWTRDHAREKQVNERTSSGSQVVFHIAARRERPAARLYFWHQEDRDAYLISNIVPEQVSEMTMAQYNSIVEEFRDVCAPIAQRLGLDLKITSNKLDMAHLLTPRSMKALESFELNANVSSLHPLDEKRWRRFLILAYEDKVALKADILLRWLTEEKGWPEERAFKLIIEYEFAFELLKDFDGAK